MGIVVLTEHLSEIPFFFFGEYAIKLFGHTRIIACACVVYAFRYVTGDLGTREGCWLKILIKWYPIGNSCNIIVAHLGMIEMVHDTCSLKLYMF